MKQRIAYTKPSITDLEIRLASDAAAHGWGERCYEYLNRFEREFGRHIGCNHAIATSSCTGALHMGLAALGVGHGDEVVVADTNWIASVAPIVHLGAKPVFVDICPDTWCIDPAAVRAAITSRTKAILAVHIYGNLCNMQDLLDIGSHYGVPVVEDAAEAIGSVYKGKRAGSIGRFGVFSFHGTKTITTGEGGMFVTNDSALYERVLTLSNHGRARGQTKQFWPDVIGHKYKMSNVQAAIGCAQLSRVGELVARKRDILDRYKARLGVAPEIQLNVEHPETQIGAWMPTAVFDGRCGVTREALLEAFRLDNIDARVFFHPLSSLPMFKPSLGNVHAWDIPSRAINLPSYHDMSDEDLDRVVSILLGVLHGRKS